MYYNNRTSTVKQPARAQRAKMSRQGLLKIEKGGNATLGILLANALDCQISDFFPHKAPWRWKE
jgi:DNA-binding XRE family transcriptional regulator